MEIDGKLIEPLITCSEASYGERFHDHLLEQYKLYVESARHVSDRRESANNYFLTINSHS